jgi:cytochrome c-type biogenesis protein CcmH/NrfF
MVRFARTLLLLALLLPQAAYSDVVDDLGAQLLCQCGNCGYLLGNCGMHGCSSRAEMTQDIEQSLAEGKKENEIVQDFMIKYGLKVLATPPAEGFNRLLGILPILGGGLGLVIAGLVVSRLRKKAAVASAQSPESFDPAILQRVEKELKDHSR